MTTISRLGGRGGGMRAVVATTSIARVSRVSRTRLVIAAPGDKSSQLWLTELHGERGSNNQSVLPDGLLSRAEHGLRVRIDSVSRSKLTARAGQRNRNMILTRAKSKLADQQLA